MIKEILRKSVKDGMKQPLFREALEREKLRSNSLAFWTDQASFLATA